MEETRVYNKSSQEIEDAELSQCPRCRGFGGVFSDDGDCYFCGGYGELYLSDSGWGRAIDAEDLEQSQLY